METLAPSLVPQPVVSQLPFQQTRVVSGLLKGGERSRSTSMVSLTVETALGSFDFLNASDWEDEEDSNRKHPSNRPVTTDFLSFSLQQPARPGWSCPSFSSDRRRF